MTLEERITKHEGRMKMPYEDSEGNLTIGVGHNLDSRGLPEHIIDELLRYDIQESRDELDRIYPDWRHWSNDRRDAMTELMFNMGAPALLTFVKMWAAIRRDDWETAADELLDSKWAKQVGPNRSTTLAELLR
jgi:lysozyme